jgi:flagellar biosynthetic protein FliO
MMRRLLSLLVPLLVSLPLAAGAQQGAASAPAASAPAASAPAAGPVAPDVAAPNPAASGNAPAAAVAPAPTTAPAVAPSTVPNTPPVTMPSASPTGSLLQTLFALIVVLGALAALAWFLKRYGPRAGGANANVKVVGSLNLGGRERLLVVEVGNQWIVVGASPGRVNGLATMPKQEGVDATATLVTTGPSANSFADWLRQTIEKRK